MKSFFSCWSPKKSKASGSSDGGDDGAGPSAPAPPPSPDDSGEGPSHVPPVAEGLPRFTYAELSRAAAKFGPENFLGQGWFGKVYRADLNSRQSVAVKFLINKQGAQDVNEFLEESRFLYAFNHPNIMKLLGVCTQRGARILVYDYMPLGDLYTWLTEEARRKNLDWNARMKIAHGVAKGLLYLHDTLEPQAAHGDVQPRNILLEGAFDAKLSDYKTQTARGIEGMVGAYLSPEYFQTGRPSATSDVYSFGLILLELLTGRSAASPDRPTLVEVAMTNRLYDRKFSRIADPLLGGRYPKSTFEQIARAASRCTEVEPANRLLMREVEPLLGPDAASTSRSSTFPWKKK